jgi:uncharacterized heparinase superfamily protein
MYHALVLEDLLDLVNLSRALPAGPQLDAARLLEPRIAAMLEWLRRMVHPDGEIAFFNDAALGIAPTCAELVDYAARLGLGTPGGALEPVEWLDASGYVRIGHGAATLIADVGEIGPPHLTGHAHADTLSFELSLGRERVIVNSGTSRYGSGAERARQRSTSAHSTLEIDGENSSEVWGGFRVGRRAHAALPELREDGGEIVLRCSHDGYRHRPGRPVHERIWRLTDHRLSVCDRVEGGFRRARASYHLAPDIRAQPTDHADRLRLSVPDKGEVSVETSGGTLSVEPTSYHPRFGTSLPSSVLRLELSGMECSFRMDWT